MRHSITSLNYKIMIRDRKYLDWLRTQPCLFSGQFGSENLAVDPAHIGTAGKGLKSSDDEAIPLLHTIHLEAHQRGEMSVFREHIPNWLLRESLRAYAREQYQEYLRLEYGGLQNNKTDQFIKIRLDIFESNAFRSLSSSDRAAYLEFRRRFNGNNNGEISISVREISERCDISKTTASRSLKKLIEAGLVRVTQDAGFNQKSGRRARRWRLTDEGYKGAPPTNEWQEYKN